MNRVDTVFLTVDFEEWYEIEYCDVHTLKSTGAVSIPRITAFLDMLDRQNIKATFFVVGEIAKQNEILIKDISKRGHTIACHGMDHRPLSTKTNEEFVEQVTDAKKLIEEITQKSVCGYRASCFSMDRDKLDLLPQMGFTYDSSKIDCPEHPLYGKLSLEGYSRVDDLVYTKKYKVSGSSSDDVGFYEYELPTLKIGKKRLPISGGGYQRLFPLWLIKILIKKFFLQGHSNYIMFEHPFELTSMSLPLPNSMGLVNKFRRQVGRKHNLEKTEKIIKFLKEYGAVFDTLDHYRTVNLANTEK